ncbi:hypothetical protein C0Q70_01192 [Pomacea canaliculata]|uniref:Uncharacterized protein n=1 Tax=Pomacea canaliculata TaxID=400727 RepID=A0A2T7PYR8_POMCA|nr:uncharacterized protein LOC112556166 [Pomacea canaliculata]PVD38576.1 hypothetical protein C0Q70_01192 [Pomacea canaliculata]
MQPIPQAANGSSQTLREEEATPTTTATDHAIQHQHHQQRASEMGWTLGYLFYVGIILPTVVTLVLFVLFVLCWRRQSARKEILTKPYDPHGAMRRLGMTSQPPPPPVFVRTSASATESLGGEDNGGYDMSRSPSTETEATNVRSATFHSRLDSGLSEPSCDLLCIGGDVGVGLVHSQRDRPQSQASHSSTTDSEDSGFRSSRSGPYPPNGHLSQHEMPLLKPTRVNSISISTKGKMGYHRPVGTPSPDRATPPALQLSPTAWPHNYHQLSDPATVRGAALDLNDIGANLGWKYLQELSSPPVPKSAPSPVSAGPHRQLLTCHQTMTSAQVHQAQLEPDNRDVFGFSIV